MGAAFRSLLLAMIYPKVLVDGQWTDVFRLEFR